MKSNLTIIIGSLLLILGCENKPITVQKSILESGSKSLFQAISIIDEKTTWISGHKATFARTDDGGKNWTVYKHPSDTLQFRDIHALDGSNIVLMSAGTGASSRIYLFDAKSEEYRETYVMPHKEGFLNTIEFWDENIGLAFGDSFNGELFVLKTEDGGQSWDRIDPAKLPAAGLGEGGFAASGTCISIQPKGKAWIATGAGGNSRILFTPDFGDTWTEYSNPIVKGDAAGVASINMLNENVGLIVGGNLATPDDYTDNVAITKDGGVNWSLTNHPITKGGLYGSSMIMANDLPIIMACGPNGIDYSLDQGQSWNNIDTANYWAVKLHPDGFGYATGKDGNILKLEIGCLK